MNKLSYICLNKKLSNKQFKFILCNSYCEVSEENSDIIKKTLENKNIILSEVEIISMLNKIKLPIDYPSGEIIMHYLDFLAYKKIYKDICYKFGDERTRQILRNKIAY